MDFYSLSNRHLSEESDADLLIVEAEETLVIDTRAGLTPAQMVERRLASLLQNGSSAVQSPHARGSFNARG